MDFFLNFLFEVLIVLIITSLFYQYLRPKLRYFFYGSFFFFIGLILQLPIRYFYTTMILGRVVNMVVFTNITYVFLSVVILEVTKYFSLKKFIKTKNFKNAMFFGIGWVSFQSINLFTILFFQQIFNFLTLDFDYSYLLNPNYSILNFGFFFVLNLAITVYVILAIIKKDFIYLFFAIAYSCIVTYALMILVDLNKFLFSLGLFFVSLFVIFYYHKINYIKYISFKKTRSSK